MSATTTDAAIDTGLTPELIDRLMRLSPEDKDRVALFLLEDLDPPPGANVDWPAEIRRRLEAVAAGEIKPMSRAESDAAIRAEMRKLGVELP
jgi:hypothetical protein